MPEEKIDVQENQRRAREEAPVQTSDALIERQQSFRKMREESARIQAERDLQEQHQKDRQARHLAEAKKNR